MSISNNNRVYLQKCLRTSNQFLTSPEEILAKINGNLPHRRSSNNTENISITEPTTEIIDPIAYLYPSDHHKLVFKNIIELLNATDTLSETELITHYSPKTDFWNRIQFPLDLLLNNLSADYSLEKVQFSEIEEGFENIIDSDTEKVISYCFDDGDDNFEYGPQDYIDDSAQENWKNQVLYQIREKSTQQVISEAITAEQLPMAIFVSNQIRNKSDEAPDKNENGDWDFAHTDIAGLPIEKPDQLTSYLNEDSWSDDEENHYIPTDKRTPFSMEGGLLVEDNTLWTDYHAINSRTTSGLYPFDFVNPQGIFFDKLIHQALESGLQIAYYQQEQIALLESTLANARKDFNHSNYEEHPYDKKFFHGCFEIIDSATGKVLDTQIGRRDLVNCIIKNLWQD
ncbi:hypothetical protein [Companilactobacillus kimchiensis]|uniref:Uncharacterized protein n=1 Tax=Companilactobacillus kimchiensis TaxID=993692 RepID=A0A0R2LDQ5_9LACO|nr:hypothetical protein [Companilactobacillus kimchiensis]KRN96749.1 hypothetical protein IV57_GL001760 [Companilactobacillus kimchiensis]